MPHISFCTVLAAVSTTIFARRPPARSMKRDRISLSRLRSSPPPMITRWPMRPSEARLLTVLELMLDDVGWHGAVAGDGGLAARQRDQSDVARFGQQRDGPRQRLLERDAALDPFIDDASQHSRHDLLADASAGDRALRPGPEAAARDRRVAHAAGHRR